MKQVKMMLYGDPGVGKSTFALGFPKPYFITTDGNYEWLEDFGAKEEDHTQVDSWEQAKKVFALDFEGYDTIVILSFARSRASSISKAMFTSDRVGSAPLWLLNISSI